MRLLVSGTTESLRRVIVDYRSSLGFLLVPGNGNKIESVLRLGVPWACDNGAFTMLDVPSFLRMLGKIHGQKPLWVTCPDRVADARETLRLWSRWAPLLQEIGLPRAFVLQDGQERLELPDAEAYFIGGSTRFKLSQAAADLVCEGKRRGGVFAHGPGEFPPAIADGV